VEEISTLFTLKGVIWLIQKRNPNFKPGREKKDELIKILELMIGEETPTKKRKKSERSKDEMSLIPSGWLELPRVFQNENVSCNIYFCSSQVFPRFQNNLLCYLNSLLQVILVSHFWWEIIEDKNLKDLLLKAYSEKEKELSSVVCFFFLINS